ncbi:hypothetical protein [Anabaena azotica]|uniref:hypothetical protein n=1 Tax=Anabaena azotica TaxID=197653 RepID=UPI0039A687E5
MVRKLIYLALIRLVFATEWSLLFSDLSCFTLLSRPVSAVILPETFELYQKAVLEGRGFKPSFLVTSTSSYWLLRQLPLILDNSINNE